MILNDKIKIFCFKGFLLAINLVALCLVLGIPIFLYCLPYRFAALRDNQVIVTLDKEKQQGYSSLEGYYVGLICFSEISESNMWKSARLLDQSKDEKNFEILCKGFRERNKMVGSLGWAILSVYRKDYESLVKRLRNVFEKEKWEYTLQGNKNNYFERRASLQNDCCLIFDEDKKNLLLFMDILHQLELPSLFSSLQMYLSKSFTEKENLLFKKLLVSYGDEENLYTLLENPEKGIAYIQEIQDWEKKSHFWAMKAIFYLILKDYKSFEKTIQQSKLSSFPLEYNEYPPGCEVENLEKYEKNDIFSELLWASRMIKNILDKISIHQKVEILKNFLDGYYFAKMQSLENLPVSEIAHKIYRSWLLEAIWELFAIKQSDQYHNLFNILQFYVLEMQKKYQNDTQNLPSLKEFDMVLREYNLLLWYIVSGKNVSFSDIRKYFETTFANSVATRPSFELKPEDETLLEQGRIPSILGTHGSVKTIYRNFQWKVYNQENITYEIIKKEGKLVCQPMDCTFFHIPEIVIGNKIRPLIPGLPDYLLDLQHRYFQKLQNSNSR